MIFNGSSKISKLFIGSRQIKRGYKGYQLFYKSGIPYIKNGSNSYIDLGVYANENTQVYLGFKDTSTNLKNKAYFGSGYMSAGNNNFALVNDANGELRFYLGDMNRFAIADSITNEYHTYHLYQLNNQANLWVDDVDQYVQNTYSTNYLTPGKLRLFGRNASGTTTASGATGSSGLSVNVKMAYCKIQSPVDSNGNVLPDIDLIPAIDSNGKVCMYDSISGKYTTDEDSIFTQTGTFTYGDDIND